MMKDSRSLVASLIGTLWLALAPLAQSQEPLNVLWLSVEDMSPWIGPYGDRTVPTPALDGFAREAIRYDNAFADSPVCAPARTALITGTYPTRMGAMHMRVRSRSLPSDTTPIYEAVPPVHARCFPETLQLAGYYTTNCAKEDYQFRAPAWTWNDSSRKADYANRPSGTPFFSVFNHGGTHESQAFPEAKRRPSAVEDDSVPIPPIYPDTPRVRDALKRTYDNIAAMDRWFGGHLERLEKEGLAESTVVFFFSDHGVGLPRGKRSLYGTGTRVPLLVRFPKGRGPQDLPPGSATDRIVSFIDFGPTVLSLAGIAPDLRLDGRAFLGAHAAPPRELAFFHADRFDSAMDRTRAVTDGTRLVIRNLMPEVPHLIANAYRERIPMTWDLYALRDGGDRAWTRAPAQWQVGSTRRPEVEWYDRTGDPWEVRNLAGSEGLVAEERAAFGALDAALEAWMTDTGDLGLVAPEEEMIRRFLWPPDGEQPQTAAPSVERAEGGGWVLKSSTPGASLAYRLGPDGPWHTIAPGQEFIWPGPGSGDAPPEQAAIQLWAHRAGFAPSRSLRH
ncbi:Sulfatase [Planctomycetes bacterium Poly30]|uniref:Sulfatase n=1 Tax=Saltatorellus ferox TaxID=2528018 RepID=A0A518EQP8_9BACT|nr:Sulfatase [Planctomycetes bacterium Poly30]